MTAKIDGSPGQPRATPSFRSLWGARIDGTGPPKRAARATARAVAARLDLPLVHEAEVVRCHATPEGKQECSLAGNHPRILAVAVDEFASDTAVVRVRLYESVPYEWVATGHVEVFMHSATLLLARGPEGSWHVERVLKEGIT